MAATASLREGDGEAMKEESSLSLRQQRQVNLICAHMGMNVLGLTVALVARQTLLVKSMQVPPAQAAQFMARLSTFTAVIEFLLNPIAGKLSDAWGRKRFLMQAPAVSALLKLLVFARPSATTIALERCVSGACTTIGGSTTCSSALADLIKSPTELGRAYAQLGTAAGIGVVFGPMIGAAAMGKSGNVRRPFLLGSFLSVGHFALVSLPIRETLVPAARKQLGSAAELVVSSNPLSFLRVYVNGSVVARLCSIAAFQCLCEGKSISDLNTYYLQNEAKFTDTLRSLYLSSFGVVMTFSGIIGKQMIATLGMRGHTTFQNLATILGFGLMGSTTNTALIFAVLPIYAFAMERRAAISSLAVKSASAAGMGTGEFSAAFANLRAIAVGVAPILYAKMYASGLAATPRSPGRPFYTAALVALVAELLHRTLKGAELDFSAATPKTAAMAADMGNAPGKGRA